MGDYVKLANEQGAFNDPETGFNLSRDDRKELIPPVGKKTRDRLATGALVKCDPSANAESVENDEAGPDGETNTEPSDPDDTQAAPDLGDGTGQAEAETDGADLPDSEPEAKSAPAPKTPKKRTKRAPKKQPAENG